MMPHVHLLAAWQNNDIDKIRLIIDENIQSNIIDENGMERELNYQEFTKGLEAYLDDSIATNNEWQFDVIHKTERGTASIVIVNVYRSEGSYSTSETAALCIFTFDTVADNTRKMIRAYVEKGVANN